MPTRQEQIDKHTYPECDTGRRVHYTISGPEPHEFDARHNRIVKAISLLVVKLEAEEIFSKSDIDDFLLDVAL